MNERSDEPIGWRQVEEVGQVIDNLSTKEGPCMSEPAFFPLGHSRVIRVALWRLIYLK